MGEWVSGCMCVCVCVCVGVVVCLYVRVCVWWRWWWGWGHGALRSADETGNHGSHTIERQRRGGQPADGNNAASRSVLRFPLFLVTVFMYVYTVLTVYSFFPVLNCCFGDLT